MLARKSFKVSYVHVTHLECVMCDDFFTNLLILNDRDGEGIQRTVRPVQMGSTGEPTDDLYRSVNMVSRAKGLLANNAGLSAFAFRHVHRSAGTRAVIAASLGIPFCTQSSSASFPCCRTSCATRC